MLSEITQHLEEYLSSINDVTQKINVINSLRTIIHSHSPFSHEPVDCVMWIDVKRIYANDYNPNEMANIEKKLLARSIEKDGFTQPIVVVQQEGKYFIVDGFHRYVICKTCQNLHNRFHGYLPVSLVNAERQGEKERIAATVRHNRARGKHQISAMSNIIRDLSRQGWNSSRIGEELGMDAEEVLRLKQINGLTELFRNESFSMAWTVE